MNLGFNVLGILSGVHNNVPPGTLLTLYYIFWDIDPNNILTWVHNVPGILTGVYNVPGIMNPVL
eukprot:920558-Pyramimonas_sp.AAC.1